MDIRKTGNISAAKRFVSLVLCAVLISSFAPLYVNSFEEDYDLPWLWPVPGSFAINCLDIYYGGGRHNQGQCMDIGANGYTGENRLSIVSATNGEVVYTMKKYSETGDRGSGWGNYVIIKSGNVNIVYAHLRTVDCQYGDRIKAGDVIGTMGQTGNATGVHLHIQAYPYGKGYDASSTEIYVFEKFMSNPLYYPSFRFMKGLTASPRYGDFIQTYYTRSSGSYYAYSGGYDADVELIKTDARVTVISSSGAPVRSTTLSDNSYITDTVPRGGFIDVSGYFTDAYGTCWLRTEDGWIIADDVGFYTYNDSLEMSGAVLPSGTVGSVYAGDVGGVITSGHPISVISAVIASGDVTVWEKTVAADRGVTSADVAELFSGAFEGLSLPDGDYTFSVKAAAGSQYPGQDAFRTEKTLAESDFTIDTGLADTIPPIIEDVGFDYVRNGTAAVSVKASDERGMESVVLTAKLNGDAASSFVCAPGENGRYVCEVPCEGSGTLIVTVTAKDASGNTTTASRSLELPETPDIADWQVVYKSGMNIRSAPSTSASKVGSASQGDILTIYETVTVGNYVWGRLGDGSYIAISYGSTIYLTRVESHVFSVFFDLNGGSGTAPETVSKTAGNDIALPSDIPERSGYTFLGWSECSYSAEAAFAPSDVFDRDETVCLFAVYSDTTSPSIIGITQDVSDWTSGPVTVTVHAADNTGTVYYSFDGGATWLADGVVTVKQNTVFEAGVIQVRDPSGNITSNQTDYPVTNIDRTAPSVSSAATAVGVSGNRASITFGGVTDGESGVRTVSAYLARDPEMTSPLMFDITGSGIVELDDGVWYGRLVFYDAVGNSASVALRRFAVGSVPKLGAPSGLTAVSTGSSYGDFTWEPVENCDGYEVEASVVDDFSDPAGNDVANIVCYTERVTIDGLEPGLTYYVRVRAITSDGVYPPSDFTDSLAFMTLSDDVTLYGFVSLDDATVNVKGRYAEYIAPYGSDSVDVTAVTNESASAEYYSDSALTAVLTDPSDVAFGAGTQSLAVYIKVIAENGSDAVYTLRISRAGELAQTPVCELDAGDASEAVLTGDLPGSLLTGASVYDGGTLSYEWRMETDGAEAVVGDGPVLDIPALPAGEHTFYCVVTNTNVKCLVTTASAETERFTVTVSKRTSQISAVVSSFVYSGEPASGAVSGYTGDGRTSVRFYSDRALSEEIDPPTDAGTYYAVAYAAETDDWAEAVSSPVSFMITKAPCDGTPEYEIRKPTPRDPSALVTVTTDGTEYRVNGGAWTAYSAPVSLSQSDVLEMRIAETRNRLAGEPVTVSGSDYAGITDILPNGMNSVTRDGDLIVISEFTEVTRGYLEAGIIMSEYIVITDANGEELPDDGTVTSGCSVMLADDDGVIMSLTVIVSGDVNGDGRVDSSDARLALKFSNGTARPAAEWSEIAADADSDGVITSTDALIISKRAYP